MSEQRKINNTSDLIPVMREGVKCYVLRENCTDTELSKWAAEKREFGKKLVQHAKALEEMAR